jgi:pimeloyl-ACP methyl ester carboxylesterase
VFYVGVPDVEAALQRAERLGGTRLMGPATSPSGLVVGHFADPDLTTMLSDSHPAATRVALTAFEEADLRPALPEIAAPTLMIYGERDVRSPREV